MGTALRLSDLPPAMTQEDLWRLIGRLEHEALEFKRASGHLSASMTAMSMTNGGIIMLGVEDDRTLSGCELTQKVLDAVTKTAHSCGLAVDLKEFTVDGTSLVAVAVPEVRGRIVTTPDGRLLRRLGSDNQPLVGDALARFVREREQRSGEDEPVSPFDLNAVDIEQVNRVLEAEGRSRINRRSLWRALVDIGVAVRAEPPLDGYLLRAGVLLFARDPSLFIQGAAVQIVRRAGLGPGPGPVTARAEMSGPLPVMVEGALSFVLDHTGQIEAVVGTHREDFPEYPTAALREALLNAVAHRDYWLTGATVDVTIWDDRVEIQSPGPLPGHITVDNMRTEHYSRNRRLMQVLKVLDLVEEYGEGVDRMFDEMESRLMEPPGFVATSSSVTVTLHNRSALSVDDQAWLALLGHLGLSAGERRLLVLARREGNVTPRLLRAQIGESTDVDALLAGALSKGLVVRVGRGGGARYVLSDEVVMRAGGAGVEARSRKRQMLLNELIRRNGLSTAEAAAVLDEDDRTLVKLMLDDLVRAGQAVAVGNTRARRYLPAADRNR